MNPSRAIFPVVRFGADGLMDLLGTGFFISTNGLFVTARHVLSAPFDSRGRHSLDADNEPMFNGSQLQP
jgi:hypothetical protein